MPSTAIPRPHPDVGTELVRDWRPVDESRGTFVLVHGLAEHSGRYERTGDLLAESGFWVRGFDLIGAGGSGGRRWDIDDWSRYHQQIEGHVAWAREQGGPVVLMGHSMGGNLVLGYLIGDRVAPDLAVVSAPATGGGAGWQRALAPFLAKIAPTLSVPNRLKGEQLSRDPTVAEAYFSDPLVHTSSTPRLGAGLFAAMDHVKSNVGRVNVPTLVLHGGLDTIVPPQTTVSLGDLPGFERRLYPGLRHEILNEPEGPSIVAEILAWVDSKV
ncbi:MAG: lysophospholipase [Actinobacteria bacterium]|nr:lysophospholipase [Actinomycetota bacterium]